MKFISKEFVLKRTKKTRDAAVLLAATPFSFVWEFKTNLRWREDVVLLDELESTEIFARTEWRNAAELWDGDLRLIQEITRDVTGYAVNKFQNDPVKLKLFTRLRTDGRSRDAIHKQGKAARDAWGKADPIWVIKKKVSETQTVERTLGELGSLLAAAGVHEDVHGGKEAAWHLAVAALNTKLGEVNQDCMNWHRDVTRHFPAGTTAGDMVRASVPTTSRAEEPVGQAVLSNVMVTGDGTIHADCAAEHGTKFTYLHRAPGAAAFVVVVTDSPETSITLHHQAPGVHELKAIGSNARGEGAESAVIQVTVAQREVA